MSTVVLNRRSVLAGGGALIVSFSLRDAFAQDQARAGRRAAAARQPEGRAVSRFLDSHRCRRQHHRLHRQGRDRPGFQDRLSADRGRRARCSLRIVEAGHSRYSRTANEGYTSGSNSMKDSGTAVQNAAAQVRALLIAEAARRLELPAENLKTDNGAVIAPDGRRLGYGELVAGEMLHVQAQAEIEAEGSGGLSDHGPVDSARGYSGQGHGRRRLCPGHASARDGACTGGAAAELWRGVDRVRHRCRRKNAWRGRRSCATAISSPSSQPRSTRRSRRCGRCRRPAKWRETARLPKQDNLPDVLTSLPSRDETIFKQNNPSAVGARTIEATYTRPYQAHGSIGPSCAVAQLRRRHHDGVVAHPRRLSGSRRASRRCCACRPPACA